MISIVTPVYNGKRFIESCIQVVINQNCSEIEHIIVDGGSVDGTVEIIKQYAEKYPHIRWISEADRGQSDALNKGISLARGKIFTTLNVDDYYETNVLNRVLEIFHALPEPSLLVGNCNVWDETGQLKFVNKPKKLKLSDLLLGFKANQFPVNPSAYFYHTSLHEKIGHFKVEEQYAMDLDLLLRAVQASTVVYIDEIWGNFQMFEGTKTVNDKNNKQARLRKENLLKSYRKDLPLLQRLQVAVGYEFYKAWGTFEYFLDQPQDIAPIAKRKFLKALGLTTQPEA